MLVLLFLFLYMNSTKNVSLAWLEGLFQLVSRSSAAWADSAVQIYTTDRFPAFWGRYFRGFSPLLYSYSLFIL